MVMWMLKINRHEVVVGGGMAIGLIFFGGACVFTACKMAFLSMLPMPHVVECKFFGD